MTLPAATFPAAALLLSLALPAALPAGAAAQGNSALLGGDRPQLPYEAVVAVPSAEIRSGAGQAFYPVGKLERGARVTVRDEFLNWYRIDTPEGVTCYVKAKDVEESGNSGRGVITADQTYAFLAGLQRGAAESFRRDRVLKRGTEVRIIERLGAFYRIQPPAQSRVFLAPGTLEPYVPEAPVETAEAAEAEVPTPDTPAETAASLAPTPVADAPAPTIDDATGSAADASASMDGLADAEMSAPSDFAPDSAPSDVRAEIADASDLAAEEATDFEADSEADFDAATDGFEAATAEADIAVTEPTMSEDGADFEVDTEAEVLAAELAAPAASGTLAAVEQEMRPKFDLPIGEQPLDDMAAAYADLDTEGLSAFDQRVVASRLAMIDRNREIASTLTAIQATREDLQTFEPIEVAPDPGAGFAAVGILRASRVFNSDGSGPTLFRVVDPASGRTLAYIRPAGDVDPTGALGEVVGVRGTSQFDPSLNTTLITASGVTAFAPAQ